MEESSVFSWKNLRRSTHIFLRSSSDENLNNNKSSSMPASIPISQEQVMELVQTATAAPTEEQEAALPSKTLRRSTHIFLHSLVKDSSAGKSSALLDTSESITRYSHASSGVRTIVLFGK